eukprot:TRINITY_DN18594_c0_g1_i2.p1 TRINITY_DN18594_c0_g1~~TRINITY_DN18594_c0_g1_i2.p1  ORF type:complete len:157 (+),score=26.55 TRINITY_DN18594_c0_g1_i2:42-512(+)
MVRHCKYRPPAPERHALTEDIGLLSQAVFAWDSHILSSFNIREESAQQAIRAQDLFFYKMVSMHKRKCQFARTQLRQNGLISESNCFLDFDARRRGGFAGACKEQLQDLPPWYALWDPVAVRNTFVTVPDVVRPRERRSASVPASQERGFTEQHSL